MANFYKLPTGSTKSLNQLRDLVKCRDGAPEQLLLLHASGLVRHPSL